jgi:hypothetical protein
VLNAYCRLVAPTFADYYLVRRFGGEKKPVSEYGPSGAAPAEEKEDEDDIDLFGSDDEVDEEAERLKQQRLEEYRTKKAASMFNSSCYLSSILIIESCRASGCCKIFHCFGREALG